MRLIESRSRARRLHVISFSANDRISRSLPACRSQQPMDRNIGKQIDIFALRGDRIAALCFSGMICIGLPAITSAAVINRGQEGPPLSEIRPAPKSIYPDQQVITAQPSPSEVDPAYLGPVLLMKSAVVDLDAGTATLPLRKGAATRLGDLVLVDLDYITTDPNLVNLHGGAVFTRPSFFVNTR